MSHRAEHTLSRRALMAGVGAASIAAIAARGLQSAPTAYATSAGTVLPLVDPLSSEPDRSQFGDTEHVFAAYLTVVAPIANSIRDEDPHYGWMEDGWWRSPEQPYNAREMEQVATLSWFLTHERSWNPYFGDAKLRDRIEAALSYYLGSQLPNGSWSEYEWNVPHLAPTGFGSVALSTTYRYLDEAGELRDWLPQIEAAVRASSAWLVDRSLAHWRQPTPYTNQVVAGLAGASMTAELFGDEDLSAEVSECWETLRVHGISGAGHSHEPLAYDFDYSFIVAMPDLGAGYLAGFSEPVEMARSMAEFISYASVLEPDRAGFLNWSAASARIAAFTHELQPDEVQDRTSLGRALIGEVPVLAAFHPTDAEIIAAREAWKTDPGPIVPLEKKRTSPRTWMHSSEAPLGVSEEVREEAIATLPYLASDRFTEFRQAGSVDLDYLFVRRPSYYLTTLLGRRAGHGGPYQRLRMGPGLLWHPSMGAVIMVLNSNDEDAWGPFPEASAVTRVEVARSYYAEPYGEGGKLAVDQVGAIEGDFSAAYLDRANGSHVVISFFDDSFVQTIKTDDPGRAVIPLLMQPGDLLTFSDGTEVTYGDSVDLTGITDFRLERGAGVLVVELGNSSAVTFDTTDRVRMSDTRRQHLIRVEHGGSLQVTYAFEGPVETATQVPGSGVLSSDNGHRGTDDGNYDITMNLWWGTNAHAMRLLENGKLIAHRNLVARSPQAQAISVPVRGRRNGDYHYTAELLNAAGTVQTSAVTVEVRHADPGAAVLSHNNYSGARDFVVTTNMWWGTNADWYRLYENDSLIDERALENNTPHAQAASTQITDREPGTYVYRSELLNPAGITSSEEIRVVVN
ncbi:hypothetical protein [Occultella gossypii]|uniref:Uncharacterized protein n=1 Tax=Occultella gossypii TaxID=2800820 RepID=A0ABS7SGA9_9MICO|nr:hypothetical protein [Occultella gossypii]MBZ2199395.1 hypothetical protein [Occultella gossypii]